MRDVQLNVYAAAGISVNTQAAPGAAESNL